MKKRPGPHRNFIHTHDIAAILGCGLRKAQKLLQATRIALNKDKKGFVSISEFCHLHKWDVKETRKALGVEVDDD